jgi:hypothetical protein
MLGRRLQITPLVIVAKKSLDQAQVVRFGGVFYMEWMPQVQGRA